MYFVNLSFTLLQGLNPFPEQYFIYIYAAKGGTFYMVLFSWNEFRPLLDNRPIRSIVQVKGSIFLPTGLKSVESVHGNIVQLDHGPAERG
jgi:hypothetical protein